jgi:hypothetical protein
MIAMPGFISRRNMMEQERDIVSFPGEASDSGENISEGAGTGSDSKQVSSDKGKGFMTEATFDAKMKELDAKFEAFGLEQQSRTDKAVTDVREKVNIILNSDKDLIESGVELTEAQKAQIQAAKNEKIAKLIADTDGEETSGKSGLDPDPKPKDEGSEPGDAESDAVSKEVNALTKVATDIMDEVGARVYDDDPEAKDLLKSRDKAEYLANVKTASERKLARLNRDPATLGTGFKPGEKTVMDGTNSELWDDVKEAEGF